MSDAERAEVLAEQLIRPLLVGGAVQLQRPFGSRLALSIGEGRSVVDNDTRMLIDRARLRHARAVVAVDALPPLGAAEWAMAAALHDLLQVSNHELSSFASRSRHGDLLESCITIAEHVADARTLEEVVSRHATFARMLEIRRRDTRVSWWSGSASFRGQEPSPRLLAWPKMRGVQIQRSEVSLATMCSGVPVEDEAFGDGVNALLHCTPLTDLATAQRADPPFVWSSGTLSLVATRGGANLALRALRGPKGDHDAKGALPALHRAGQQLPAHHQTAAYAFFRELEAALAA
jgi:hypothetical protein